MTETTFSDSTGYPSIALYGMVFSLLVFLVLMYYYATDKMLVYFFGVVELVLLASAYYMYKVRFNFELSTDGLHYTLDGFSKKQNTIPMYDIEKLSIVSLDYTTKFGGWGNRKNKNGEAFVFNDGMFLEVQTVDKKLYLSISDKKKNDCMVFVSKLQTELKTKS